ncbi:MAG: quinoprotein dehydrogenase-associated putative ABC transporter substrate-binding protein, partial [Gemmatimonadales bacterium]
GQGESMSRIGLPLARLLLLGGAVTTWLAAPAEAQRPAPREAGLIRVCADPDNMPSSNDKSEGYENKIAELIAKDLNSRLSYVWYPTRRGYFRIINGMYCDMALEAPTGLDMTGVTKPYFRSGYVFVTRQGSGLENIRTLADPRLKKLKIGVNVYTSDGENSPPAMALSHYGVVGNLTGYPTFFSDQVRPEDIIKGVENKNVDLAIAWGPLAGYYAKQSTVPLVLTPLPPRDSLSDLPLQYNMGIAVRRRDKEFRDSLQAVLERKRPEIEAILKQFNVPLLPIVTEQPANASSEAAKKAGSN